MPALNCGGDECIGTACCPSLGGSPANAFAPVLIDRENRHSKLKTKQIAPVQPQPGLFGSAARSLPENPELLSVE
jgi:hypothetical protein